MYPSNEFPFTEADNNECHWKIIAKIISKLLPKNCPKNIPGWQWVFLKNYLKQYPKNISKNISGWQWVFVKKKNSKIISDIISKNISGWQWVFLKNYLDNYLRYHLKRYLRLTMSVCKKIFKYYLRYYLKKYLSLTMSASENFSKQLSWISSQRISQADNECHSRRCVSGWWSAATSCGLGWALDLPSLCWFWVLVVVLVLK